MCECVCVCALQHVSHTPAAKVQIYAKINYEHVVQIGMKTDMTCAVITSQCQTAALRPGPLTAGSDASVVFLLSGRVVGDMLKEF